MRLHEILEARLRDAALARDAWSRANAETVERLGPGVARTLGVEEARASIDDAYRTLERAIEKPTLIIATTGTTSGGKSMLINLLCGDLWLPSATQELSAGVVTVEHDPTRSTLRVETTAGALWETGEWEVKPDSARRRLKDVMDLYRLHRELKDTPGLEPPRFLLRCPTRLGETSKGFGLPPGSRVILLDLPGLNHIGDEQNAEVMRKQIRQALCLVTCNSAGTDRRLTSELLDQVVGKVKELGGSPARMLFIANKIDVFLDDEDPEIERERFVDQLTQNIRRRVAEALPERAEIAATLTVIPLSTEPALLAHLIGNDDKQVRDQALKKVTKGRYLELLPWTLKRILPADITEASVEQRNELSKLLHRSTHGIAFESKMREHIARNLPDLILPPLMADMHDALAAPLAKLDAELRARTANAHGHFEQERRRLEQAAAALGTLRSELAERCKPLENTAIAASADPVLELSLAAKTVEKQNGLRRQALAPLYGWRATLKESAVGVINAIRLALASRGEVAQKLLPVVSESHRAALSKALKELCQRGYTGKGSVVELKGPAGRESVSGLLTGLRALAQALQPVMRETLDAAARCESDRIVAALQELLQAQVKEIALKAATAAPELRGIQLPPASVDRVDEPLRWDISFKIEREVKTANQREIVGRQTVHKSERQWYTLWLWEKKWTEEHDVWGNVDRHSVTLPDVDDLCNDLLGQFFNSDPDQHFLAWLQRQLGTFKDRVRRFHDDRVAEYTAALTRVRDEVRGERDARVATLAELSRLTGEAFTAASRLGSSA